MRLLLLHDQRLFHGQFRMFYTGSDLPRLPIFVQYDQYLRLRTLSSELLDDIMPRIRRQLSLQTDQARLREAAPTRGDIDWPRTIQRGWHETPGLPPIEFETRLRQRSSATPENLFTVAVLLAYRACMRQFLADSLADETLLYEERQTLTTADEQAERELAATYARALIAAAGQHDASVFAEQVAARLRPGPNPYRDLVDWWRRFDGFRVGRGTDTQKQALAAARSDEKADAWLYELWIMLEMLHLLNQDAAVGPNDVGVNTDRLQAAFVWNGQKLRLTYNRQAEAAKSGVAGWNNSPGVRPDYTIERIDALKFEHNGVLIWREPPIVLDAKYYLAGTDPERTHAPIKKLLGDMALLHVSQCFLFFPCLPEPLAGQPITRTVERHAQRHHSGMPLSPQVHVCRLVPDMPIPALQERLRAVFSQISEHMQKHPVAITCQGVCLDPDSVGPHGQRGSHELQVLCPKPHIGPGVYDLVRRDHDCLQNERLCHVKGQPIVPPFVVRATSDSELRQQTSDIRTRSAAHLHAIEQASDDESQAYAEHLRTQIVTGVGRAVEQYVKMRGNTKTIEEHMEQWVFGEYWQAHPRALAQETQKMLISGEYVWQEYLQSSLDDWAAPAIQYCRALELELRRRLYNHTPKEYKVMGAGWTLGTPLHAFGRQNSNAQHNWALFEALVTNSSSDMAAFEVTLKRLVDGQIAHQRNKLAHGEATVQSAAEAIRTLIIGTRRQPGVLCWLAEHLDVA
jgi:hypothetical protein